MTIHYHNSTTAFADRGTSPEIKKAWILGTPPKRPWICEKITNFTSHVGSLSQWPFKPQCPNLLNLCFPGIQQCRKIVFVAAQEALDNLGVERPTAHVTCFPVRSCVNEWQAASWSQGKLQSSWKFRGKRLDFMQHYTLQNSYKNLFLQFGLRKMKTFGASKTIHRSQTTPFAQPTDSMAPGWCRRWRENRVDHLRETVDLKVSYTLCLLLKNLSACGPYCWTLHDSTKELHARN